jgi:arabinofuranosyltransferase
MTPRSQWRMVRAVVERWSRATKITFASFALVVFVFALFAYQRRWMADDGLIVVRTVRNVLEGNGPVFNLYERAEANTSTLWTYILVAFAGITRVRCEYLAVVLGLLLSVGALALGMDGTRRLLRARGSTGVIVPAGALALVGVFPFWDYATSGLETGLSFAWIALCWWLLVRGDRLKLCAFVFGLGPLVRPDLGVGAVVYFVALWALHRPSWRTTLKLAAIGVALPFAYEIFRAGYYGVLVPLPALAKSATESQWARGFQYLRDFNHPYFIWLPFVVGLGLFVYVMRKRLVGKRELLVIAAPVLTGFLNMVYVLRVGGDFMHARMMLVPVFSMLLPIFVLPLRRFTVPALALLAIWSVSTIIRVGDGRSHTRFGIAEDERVGYSKWTRHRNPIHADIFIRADKPGAPRVTQALADNQHVLVWEAGVTPMNPAMRDASVGYVVGRLGTGGAATPLDGFVIDTLGLSNPLGARITPTLPGYTGHEKVLPWSWIQADYGDPAHDNEIPLVSPYAIEAARHALQCGELAELMASVRGPMSASRFWANLTGSVRRTRLVIPNDPFEAEDKFCGKSTRPQVEASNAYPFDGWSKYGVADGIRESKAPDLGFTTRGKPENTPEWLSLTYLRPRTVSKVTLYAIGNGEMMPIDFEIQTWNHGAWVSRVKRTGYERRGGANDFELSPPVETDRIRLYATNLPHWEGGYCFQLAEIEIAP